MDCTAGVYHIQRFDRLRNPLPVLVADSYTAARQLGEASRARADCQSFVVLRVLFNSSDPDPQRYDPGAPKPMPYAQPVPIQPPSPAGQG